MEGHPATSHGTVSSGATPQPPRAPQAGLHVSPDSCPGAVARVAVARLWAGGNFPEPRGQAVPTSVPTMGLPGSASRCVQGLLGLGLQAPSQAS